ncbi:GGDEF domain-containing protein [Anaerotruncus rubiinfantis]|uniref:GGDEF domain-containing protein n=1 Tax=Anaerotruncus rubiinfantis TaxID=1720200 RepID=UPI000AE606CA|nr:GGDEF domain-containing protein [Anaerotruncus rubiinfantis]
MIARERNGNEEKNYTFGESDFLEEIFSVLTDMAVIFFDLLIYSMIFQMKKNTLLYRMLLYIGCGVILLSYFAGVYLWEIPASLAAAIFMTVPSFLLFLGLSRHKGSRFLLTFCFVDTVTLMIAFIGRYVGILFQGGSIWAFVVIVALFLLLLASGHKHLRTYYILLDTVDSGWGMMAFCTVLIYFALIFFAAYPKPMVQRLEYAPSWLVFAAVVLACYAVFLQSIRKTLHIQRQNERLEQEKRLFQLVYLDALTGLYNRAAYVERVNTLEREREHGGQAICCVMLDCNRFKQINDRFGHHAGDIALRRVADALRTVFSEVTEQLFRIGGDEFTVILQDSSPEQTEILLADLSAEMKQVSAKLDMPISVASGYAFTQQEESIENAFIRADREMYKNKAALNCQGAAFTQ